MFRMGCPDTQCVPTALGVSDAQQSGSGSVSHLMAVHSDCKETFFTVWDNHNVMLIM